VGAKDLITCTNTRPDLFTQVKNNPSDPNQLPSIGDWVVWGQTWGSGYGHVACAEIVSSVGFTSIEQNFVANTVTRQQHNWSGVIGWVHINQPQGGGMGMTTGADLDFIYQRNLKRARGTNEGDNVYLNKDYKFVDIDVWNSVEGKTRRAQDEASYTALVASVGALQKQVAALTAQVEALTAENKALKEELASVPPPNPDEVTVSKDSLWEWFKNLPFINKLIK
jgi:hypothetical protein